MSTHPTAFANTCLSFKRSTCRRAFTHLAVGRRGAGRDLLDHAVSAEAPELREWHEDDPGGRVELGSGDLDDCGATIPQLEYAATGAGRRVVDPSVNSTRSKAVISRITGLSPC